MSIQIKATLAVLAAGLVLVLLVTWRSFFLQHALLIAIAVGALVYSGLGTTERLKTTWTRKGPRSIRPRSERDGE